MSRYKLVGLLSLLLALLVCSALTIKLLFGNTSAADGSHTLDGGDLSTEEEKAIEMAKQVFMKTHTEEIVRIHVRKTSSFYGYDAEISYSSDSAYSVVIIYDRTLTYPEGNMSVHYTIRYWVEVETGKVEPDYFHQDFSIGFVHFFIGTTPITSEDESKETFFMLIDRSPGKDYWIYSVEDDLLSLEVSEMDDHYHVAGIFRCWAINCVDAKIEIVYNIFKNGTATLESVKVGCGEPTDQIFP